MENKQENSGLSEREKAIAFMLRRDKPGIAKRKAVPEPQQAPEPELVIGEQTKEGIFLGKWQPKEGGSLGKIFNFFKHKKEGTSLAKTFNVFAAPQDLPDTMTYKDTVKHIAKLKGWNGFDGTNYATDKELYKSLKDGSYNGGWIIPPRELLVGTEADGELGVRNGKVTQPDNLFDHRNKGAFRDTFKTSADSGAEFRAGWHWSSTELHDDPCNVRIANFSDGYESWNHRAHLPLSCRPVRLVEVSSPSSDGPE